MKVGSDRIYFDSCCRINEHLLKLHSFENLFEHYLNGQELQLLDKPNWVQETLLIIHREVENMKAENMKRQQDIHNRGFKDGK